MGSIITRRVVLSGSLAGLVIFVSTLLRIVVLRESIAAFIEDHNIPGLDGIEGLVFFAFYSFALGVLIAWLYAAIGPRLGPGPKTAVIGGLFYWISIYFIPYVAFFRFGLIPLGGVVVHWVWTVVEVPLASLAGAWAYKEEEPK
jgi:hypothetical protein